MDQNKGILWICSLIIALVSLLVQIAQYQADGGGKARELNTRGSRLILAFRRILGKAGERIRQDNLKYPQ